MEITYFVRFQKEKIPLNELRYWNVDLQEAYFSPIEVEKKLNEKA